MRKAGLMPQRLSRISLSVLSGALLLLQVQGCATGPTAPAVQTCVSDPPSGGLQCSMEDHTERFLDYKDSSNFVCLPLSDFKKYLEYVSNKRK